MSKVVVALDQGTTSSRAILFDHSGTIVSVGQKEHAQHFPQPGWVEHDAREIWRNVAEVIGSALGSAHLTRHDVVAVGITNQRETTVLWDRSTGEPIGPAIVWQDVRTQPLVDSVIASGRAARITERTGLPLSPYFSASKIAWMLEQFGVRERAERGELAFGTMDSWLLWNLTGGPSGGVHATDVTNASRTLLMDVGSLDWSDELLEVWRIPRALLPDIRPSVGDFGTIAESSLLRGVPITGILGDQQAALFGQAGFTAGASKATYGTGGFVMVQTGTDVVRSRNGLITTVAYQREGEPAQFALEGSVAVAGSLVQWLRDNLGLVASAAEAAALAADVQDNGGVYFVPAFSGLFAPYWRPDARGAIVGLTRFADKRHLARAAIESTAFQIADVLEAVAADAGATLTELRVDGGMAVNGQLMQFQADLLGVPVVRPRVVETTALGAAYAAGLAVGYWTDLDDVRANWHEDQRWLPAMAVPERDRLLRQWKKAVSKSLDWVDADTL
ncbi:MAG TPA: glycerol kinase GlpK [Microbacteriaceae bacterium]|nr:glycerol kinase GlpK [Microbacteriaceae bacterium]